MKTVTIPHRWRSTPVYVCTDCPDDHPRPLLYALEQAVRTRANLADADLADADLARADLADANLAGANLADADLAGANLADADLADADLARADLADANLADANLAGADLADADLADADLAGANLADANLADADLAGADLARAEHNEETRWPAGFARGISASNASVEELPVPVIPDLDVQILARIEINPACFDMSQWHSHCGTVHCMAGWTVVVSGEQGLALEARYGTRMAAARIYRASGLDAPHFFGSTDRALRKLRKRVAEQKAAAPPVRP